MMSFADLNYRFRPVKFWMIMNIIMFAALFTAAWFSYNQQYTGYGYIFIIATVLIPTVVALFMISGSCNAALRQDLSTG